MQRLAAIAAVVFGLAVLLVVLLRNEPARPSAQPAGASLAPQPASSHPPSSSVDRSEPRSELADALNLPTTDIRSDLRVVAVVLDTFRSNFPKDGNPVGDNAEITAALTGRNRLNLSLIPPDHPAINAAGELCDRWGTPFFFHAVSGTQMEIRSAGPDRRMHTADDVVQEP